MSRSYKKNPWAGDTKGKIKKRKASSKVRMFLKNLENVLQNSSYKKVSESWDICDYGQSCTWDKYWSYILKIYREHPEYFKKPPNEKEEYRKWDKCYKMK